MTIHHEQIEHAHFTRGPSMTEKEHAERCSIEHQLQRISRGLPPNWGNKDIRFGYEKMDNSLTDHKIALEKTLNDALKSDLTAVSDEDFSLLNPITQKMLYEERQNQINAKKIKQNANKKSAATPNQSAESTLSDENPSVDSRNTNGAKS